MKRNQPSVPSSRSKNGKEAATKDDIKSVRDELHIVRDDIKADLKAVITHMDKNLAEFATRNELKVEVSRLEFKIEDAKRETLGYMDKKFGQFVSHVDSVFLEIKTSREEQAAMGHQIAGHGDRLDDHEKRIEKIEAHA